MKICVVAEDVYPVLRPEENLGRTHGRAVHMKHLGEALAEAGWDVSFITWDYGQSDGERIGPFTVYKMYHPDHGVPGLRFFCTRVPGLLAAAKKADADVYVFMCADGFVGVLAWFCRRHGKTFVYFGASDRDFHGDGWNIGFKHYTLYKYGLRHAALILCQNQTQMRDLREGFGREGALLYNPMRTAERTCDASGPITWVGSLWPVKRPELFLELAEKFTDETFVMVGECAEGHEAWYEQLINKNLPSNLIMTGGQPFAEADKLISSSKLIVSTSEIEGFSNVLLQAWRRGIPTLSFHDPDGLIQTHRLGRVVSCRNELEEAVESFRRGISKATSERIKAFFDETFSYDKIAARFTRLVEAVD